MEKLNHTNWHSSQALVHGNDVTVHKRHLEKFAISVTPPQIKQRCLGDRSFQINIELIISFEFWVFVPKENWKYSFHAPHSGSWRILSSSIKPFPMLECPLRYLDHKHHHRNLKGVVNIEACTMLIFQRILHCLQLMLIMARKSLSALARAHMPI